MAGMGFVSSQVGVLMLRPASGLVAFLGSVSPWELPVSASVIPQRMSGCALLRASPFRNRVWSVWADRESQLSLLGGILPASDREFNRLYC